jgi:hypothetical protein
MRSRPLALAAVLAVAAGPALVVAPAVAKTTKKPHAGQVCSEKKKAPKGFKCKKNKKGKYVLVKSKLGWQSRPLVGSGRGRPDSRVRSESRPQDSGRRRPAVRRRRRRAWQRGSWARQSEPWDYDSPNSPRRWASSRITCIGYFPACSREGLVSKEGRGWHPNQAA